MTTQATVAPAGRDVPHSAALTLTLECVHAGYGRLPVLRSIDLAVSRGEVVALLGPNGAGKSTTLKVAAGLIKPTTGRVLLNGENITHWSAHDRARHGLCFIPEGRAVYRNLTVRENLRLFARTAGDSSDVLIESQMSDGPLAMLRDRLGTTASRLSGGQQQILALGRAAVSDAQIVMVDEASMGLAPLVVDEVFSALREMIASGAGLLLVEQYVDRALDMADRVVLLDRGEITYDGAASDLDRTALVNGYLGKS